MVSYNLEIHDINDLSCSLQEIVTMDESLETEDVVFPIAICNPIVATIQANGLATITTADVDAGSTDNCGPVTLEIISGLLEYDCTSQISFIPIVVDLDPFDDPCDNGLGEDDHDPFIILDVVDLPVITLQVTDNNGNSSTCSTTVQVIDPNLECCCDIRITSTTHIETSCPNSSDGSIEIFTNCTSCVNGITDLRYSIGNGFQASNLFENLTHGNYNIEIQDINDLSCSLQDVITLDETLDTDPPVCDGTRYNH